MNRTSDAVDQTTGQIIQDGLPYVKVVANELMPGRCAWSRSSHCDMTDHITVESYTPKVGLLPRAQLDQHAYCRICFQTRMTIIMSLTGLQMKALLGR